MSGGLVKNRAIVAIARILLGRIFIMLTRGEKFIDDVDGLTERNIRSMEEMARGEGWGAVGPQTSR